MASFTQVIVKNFMDTKQKHLRVIAVDIARNNDRATNVMRDFLLGNAKQNLALFIESRILDYFTEEYFISEDRIFPELGAMAVRGGFCCKQLLDTFIHRMQASGILNKYESDGIFYHKVQNMNSTLKNDPSKRKLTLTDVAPAFLCLLFGYFISFLVLIAEILSSRKKATNSKRKEKRGASECNEDSV